MPDLFAKTVAILQSNYLPWKGYFDLIQSVDEFIIFDDVQFTRRDWRNRNQIKTPQGPVWLTVPVASKDKFTQLICEVEISDRFWAEKHWHSIRHAYAQAPCFATMGPKIQNMLEGVAQESLLSRVNHALLKNCCGWLGITTPLTWSMDYAASGQKTDRLLMLCQAAKATHYISGPAAKAYMEADKFAQAGIGLSYTDYGGYPAYPQLHGAFTDKISMIDAFMMLGDKAIQAIMRG